MKYIIFDFDGTIGDSHSLIVKTFQDTLRKMGKAPKSAEACARTIGMRLSEAFAQLLSTSLEEGERCAMVYRDIFEENLIVIGMKPFPCVIDTIKELHRQGYVLAVASSRGKDSLMGFIRQMGIGGCFLSVVAQEDVVNVKPQPDMVFRVLAELAGTSLPKQECNVLPESLEGMLPHTLVVGDMSFDIDMAHNAGVRACAVTYGNGTREQLDSAEWVIDDFSKLLNIAAIP